MTKRPGLQGTPKQNTANKRIALISTLVIVFSLLTASQSAWASGQREADSLNCGSLVIIGARGSGEAVTDQGGFGTTVAQVADRVTSDLGNSPLIQQQYVPYSAYSTDVLSYSPNTYFSSIDFGVTWTKAWLQQRMSMCHSEHYVLLGYSAGAMLVHSTLQKLSGLSAIDAARISAVGLVADGHRVRNTPLVTFGTASHAAQGIAESSWGKKVGQQIGDVPVQFQPSTLTVCNDNDPVCDFTPHNLACCVSVHTNYAGTEVLNQLADRIASRIPPLVSDSGNVTITATAENAFCPEPYGNVFVTTGNNTTDQVGITLNGVPLFGSPFTGGGGGAEMPIAFGLNQFDFTLNGVPIGSRTIASNCAPVVIHPVGVQVSALVDALSCSFTVTVDATGYLGGSFALYPSMNGNYVGQDGQPFDPSNPLSASSGTITSFSFPIPTWPTTQFSLFGRSGSDIGYLYIGSQQPRPCV